MARWRSERPRGCDLCTRPLDKADFVDGVTPTGAWGIMCLLCHQMFGRGLGLGKGQRYNGATLEKVAG